MPKPILVGHLLSEVCDELHKLIRDLSKDEWHLPTSSSKRQVRDIVSHLLDGSLRRLSMQRDRYSPPASLREEERDATLLDYLNRLNAEWERATRRVSPKVLTELLIIADGQFVEFMNSVDPFDEAIFAVAWAGEEESQHWFDLARDYTEKWYHCQQIFDATGRKSTIISRRLYHPCLDIFMRALPHTFSGIDAEPDTSVIVRVEGDAGGTWEVVRREDDWCQTDQPTRSPAAKVIIDQTDAWKVFTKRRSASEQLRLFPGIRVEGDERFAHRLLEMVSVMA